MRIGIFSNAYKPIINGVVNCIDLIRQGLLKRGHEVFVFAPRFPGFKDQEPGIFRFPSVSLTTKIKFPIAIPFAGSALKVIPTLNLDLIHSHHPFLMGVVGEKFARRLKIPLVFTFHTQYEQYSHYIPLPQDFVRKVSRDAVTRYAKQCSLIITPGTSIIELLNEYGIKDNVVHMPNAIDLTAFENPDRKSIRERYHISDDVILLTYVGRMALEKNLPFMLDAFRIIRGKENAKLMIIGEGPELENLKRYAHSLGVEQDVIFTGRVEYADVASYYGASDLFVMTSTTEVKPLALLEAMASGLPIVAVYAHGASDTIKDGENGYLTEENREKFAEAVVSSIKDRKLLAAMSESSRRIAKGYSIEATTEKLVGLYESAIARMS